MENLAPIVLFVFNRPDHTKRTLDALANNPLASDSVLYIFADAAKVDFSEEKKIKVEETRALVQTEKRFKKVVIQEQEVNQGLAKSIIGGVKKVLSQYDAVIVLEDDIVTSKYFLQYMNKGLNKYKDEPKVMSIGAHSFELDKKKMNHSSYFLPYITCWGWATWKSDWSKFDTNVPTYVKLKDDAELSRRFDMDDSYPYTKMLFDQMVHKTVDSWCIRWYWYVFYTGGVSLFPDAPMIRNIGFDEEGTHTKGEVYEVNFDAEYEVDKFPSAVEINEERFTWIKSFIKSSMAGPQKVVVKRSLVRRILGKVKRIIS